MVAEEACEGDGKRRFLELGSVSAKVPQRDQRQGPMRRTFLGPMGLLEDLRLPMMSVPRFVRDRNERMRKDGNEFADVKLWTRTRQRREQGASQGC